MLFRPLNLIFGCALAFGATVHAQSFKIGGLVALSGPYGIYGESMKRGVEVAIAERNAKLLGRPIEVTWEDSETKPQVAMQKASKLIGGGTNLLFGATASGETVAIQELAGRSKVPLLVTGSADPRITGEKKNRYTFRTSNEVESEVNMIVKYARDTGVKRVYAVTADVSVFRDAWEQEKTGLAGAGITIVGAEFPAFGSKDYAVIIEKAAASGADMIAVMLGGSDAVTFVKQANDVGLARKAKLIGPVAMDETLAAAAGDSSIGVLSVVRYNFALPSERNKRFVAAYRKAYNEWPGFLAGEAYDGMAWLLDVIEQSGSTDPEVWIPKFEVSVRRDSVEGTKTMRACDHQALQNGYLAQVVAGTAPQPAYLMKIVAEYPGAEIMPRSACK